MLSQNSEVAAAADVEETEQPQFRCDICGKNQSKRGVPFNVTTLRMHKIKHASAPEISSDSPEAAVSSAALVSTENAPLRCDICGATGGKRGGAFRSMRDLLTHKAHAHRDEAASLLSSGTGTAGHFGNGNGAHVRAVNGSGMNQGASHVRFCPHCGCNLTVVNAALAFLDGEQG